MIDLTPQGLAAAVNARASRLVRETAFRAMDLANTMAAFAGYDAARLGRRALDFPRSTSANTVIAQDGALLRDGGHDIVRNDPSAVRIKQVAESRIVGRGLTPMADPRWMAVWERWHPNCYVHNRSNFYRLQRLCVGAVWESGGVLVRRRWREVGDLGWDGRPLVIPLQLQVIEVDQIDWTKNRVAAPGQERIVQGVQYSRYGRPVGIWIFRDNPTDAWADASANSQSVFVPYEDLAYLNDEERPGQVHSVTKFSPILSRLKRLNRFEDAELERRSAEACHVMTVEAPEEEWPDSESGRITASPVRDSNGQTIERFAPGMILYPQKGTKTQWSRPAGSPGYDEYITASDRRLASGSGFPAYSISGNLAEVNFSAARIGDVDARAWVSPWQEQVLQPLLLDVVARWVTEAAIAAGVLRGNVWDWPVDWQAPAVEEHDRKAAAEADTAEVRGGYTTKSERTRARGWDPKRVREERAKELADDADAGVVCDSDPATVSAQGQVQASNPRSLAGTIGTVTR